MDLINDILISCCRGVWDKRQEAAAEDGDLHTSRYCLLKNTKYFTLGPRPLSPHPAKQPG